MISRRLLVLLPFLAFFFLMGCASGPQPNRNGAITALANLPDKYRTSVVSLYADTSVPFPPTWYALARNYDDRDRLYTVTIKKGLYWRETPAPQSEVTSQPKSRAFVDRHKVMVDSDGAWNAAVKFAASKGRQLADAKMSLHQRNSASVPLWSVSCYDTNNAYIGKIIISANTGAVVSSR